jgi:hypothetical protein
MAGRGFGGLSGNGITSVVSSVILLGMLIDYVGNLEVGPELQSFPRISAIRQG